MKKHWCNFFEYHRRGLSRDTRKPWDDKNIPPIWQEPAEKSWDGSYPADVQPALDLQKQSRVGYEVYTGSGGSKRRRKKGAAEAGAESVRQRLAKQGVAVRLAKVLGWGGNGVASLFEVFPSGEDAPSKKVVVKSLLRQGLGMELEWSYNMVRATTSFQGPDERGTLLRLMFLLLLTTEHYSRHSAGPGISYKRVFGGEK